MLEFAREHALGLAIASVLHAALFAMLIVGLQRESATPEPLARAPVQAVAVSEADLRAAERRQGDARAAEQRREQEAEQQRRDEARRRDEAEQERQAEIDRQRERQAAEQRAEVERQAQEQQAAEAARLAEEARQAEAVRKAEEARKAEQARRETEARERAEAEVRRQAEEAARVAAARRAEEERAQAERQRELAGEIALEQRRIDLQGSSAYGAWLGAIQGQVTRNWNRPPSARPGLECEVRVSLIPGMQVVNTEILRCNGDDAVQRSIIAAVERASPLPRPSDPALFERTIVFIFKPED